MTDFPKFFDPRTLASLGGARLRARRIVEGLVAGMHRSPFRGFSIEFAEHREYAPGDDLRYLDWKVYARTDKYYLKQFEDETSLVCHVVVDASRSMAFRGPESPLSKWEYAQCLAAAVCWLTLAQHDAAGLALFDQKVQSRLPARGGGGRLSPILDALEAAEPGGETSIGPILNELAGRFDRRGVVILISDMLDDLTTTLAGLRQFHARRHDVVVWHVLDAAELEFPYQRQTLFKGLERTVEVNVDPRALRQAYLREMDDFRQHLRRACLSQRIDYRLMRTDQPFDRALAHFLRHRASN